MKRITITTLLAAAVLASFGIPAQAVVVNIDATVSGCDFNHCHGMHLPAGTVVDAVFGPSQLTLDPGTYTLTNGAALPGATPGFDAWRYDAGPQWVWSFMVIDDSTKTVVLQACCGAQTFSTEGGAANDPYAKNFQASLTLTKPTKLDFVIEDYYLPDNAGGVAINVTAAVPEPQAAALLAAGLLLVAARLRREVGAIGLEC